LKINSYYIFTYTVTHQNRKLRNGEVYMAKKVKLSEMTDMFKGLDIVSFEDVTIEGNIEIDLSGLGGGGFDPMLAAILGQENAVLAQHFARLAGVFGVPVGFGAPVAGAPAAAPAIAPALAAPKLKDLIPAKFDVANIAEWTTQIQEVPIGNTSADGGSRGKRVLLGGEKALPFFPDAAMPNRRHLENAAGGQGSRSVGSAGHDNMVGR
jgi:acetyl-CoA decarbonylase/synthase complex subunit delta